MTRDMIFKYAEESYGTFPEYLWKSAPEHAVLRNTANSKWYAIIMRVSKKTLGIDGEGDADIMNVKCDPITIGSLRQSKGFLPAYHMNKDKWISIVLDSVCDEIIIDMLNQSYDIIAVKR